MSFKDNKYFQMWWPPLSVILYWALIITLALLLARSFGLGGDGHGAGTGSGNGGSMQGGTGNSPKEDATGPGAAKVGDKGTDTGRQATGDDGNGGQDTTPGQGQGDTPDTGDDSQDESANDEGDSANGLDFDPDENLIALSSTPKIPLTKDKTNKLPKNNPEADSTREKKASHGNAQLKGSQAGKMEGFFGSGSVSGNVMFIVDISGSMMSTSSEGFILQELLKRELKKVLEAKLKALEHGEGSKETFSIITFSHEVEFFPPDQSVLSFGKESDIKRAIEFVDQLYSRGGTDMRLAWQQARPLIKKHKVKCVYFLTDGEDHSFHADDVKDIKVRVHTFSLGLKSLTLKEIAEKHKGKYTEVY